MYKLSCLLNIQNESLRQSILGNEELTHFDVIELKTDDDWIDQIEHIKPDVAIIGVSLFNSSDYERLSQLKVLSEIDLILISSGKPNDAC